MAQRRTLREYLARAAAALLGRDYTEVFRYSEATPAAIQEVAQRGIANRVASAYPLATWRTDPVLQGDDAFIASWESLNKKVNLIRAMARSDLTGGFGHYTVMLFGFSDGQALDQPIDRDAINLSLRYVRPFSEMNAEPTEWDRDPKSQNFGKPTMFKLTRRPENPNDSTDITFSVHASRCLVLAERVTDDEHYGINRVEQVWERIIDLQKLLGGSAEMFWQNAAAFYQLNADPETVWAPGEGDELKQQLDEMKDGLNRFIRTRGVTINQLAPGLMGSDPINHINSQVDFISGTTGIPKRILVGSEAGELASSQDENNWHGRNEERRNQYALPSIVVRVVEYLQWVGVLHGEFKDAFWPDSDTLGEEKRADIAVKKMTALQLYRNTIGAEEAVSMAEFRRMIGENGTAPLDEIDEQLFKETGDDTNV